MLAAGGVSEWGCLGGSITLLRVNGHMQAGYRSMPRMALIDGTSFRRKSPARVESTVGPTRFRRGRGCFPATWRCSASISPVPVVAVEHCGAVFGEGEGFGGVGDPDTVVVVVSGGDIPGVPLLHLAVEPDHVDHGVSGVETGPFAFPHRGHGLNKRGAEVAVGGGAAF